MDMNLIIQLIAGALGGNAAGAMLKTLNLGTAGNSIAGLIGGGLGGQILGMPGGAGAGVAATGSTDIAAIIASVASGGGVLVAVIGVIKNMMARK
ncbi:MAG: hypothetical protein V9G14_00970 [Cypionkella sp.]